MLVDSRACSHISIQLSSSKINQLGVIGKTRTEPNDRDQSRIILLFLGISQALKDSQTSVSEHGYYMHWVG
jgi:hypothetical protein